MSKKKMVMDGFLKDENGKWQIVPFKHLGSAQREKGSTSAKKDQPRKFIPIERLKLTPAGELEVSPQKKRRKIEKPVRKELFKVPCEKKTNNRPSYIRKSKKFTANRISAVSLKTQYQFVDNSPLLDVEKAEELLTKNCLVLKPNSPENVNDDTGNNLLTDNVFNLNKTPKSDESVKQFVQIEKALAMIETKDVESPMTSVCTLLENATINSTENNSKQNDNTIMNEIRMLVGKDRRAFVLLKQQFKSYCENHENTFNKINELLKQIENVNNENKENRVRRSGRILEQVTISKEKTKFVISPAISKKTDLRKTTLNNNLTKTLQFETQSPRTRNAVNLYNTLRSDHNVLCTPRLDRNVINCPDSGNVTRSLSRRIQRQCLLLQDTPRQSEY